MKGKTFKLRQDADDGEFQGDLPPGVARNADEFRLEFWSRISTTNPERTLDFSYLKSGCRQLARVYEGLFTNDSENAQRDRFMTIMYCAGATYQYKFYSYYENVGDDNSLNGYSVEGSFSEFEGVWNYVYIGYDSKVKSGFAGVYFSSSDRLSTVKIHATRARGRPNKIGFVIGAGFGQKTLNGLIT